MLSKKIKSIVVALDSWAEINVLKSQSEQARHELISAREQLSYLKQF